MKKWLVFLVWMAAAWVGKSQTLEATVTRTALSVGETLQYTLTLQNAQGEIRLPALDDFTIVQGPSISNSMQIINGATTRSYSETYWLRPKKKGKLTIPEATARTSGGILKSKAITIEVGEQRAGGGAAGQNLGEFYCQAYVSDRNVYVGEPLYVEYALYVSQRVYSQYRGNISAQSLTIDDSEGFWSESLDISETWDNEVINGVSFKKYVVQRHLFFPQTSGELTVGGMNIDARLGGGFFQRAKAVESTAPPIRVNVKAVPPSSEPSKGTFSEIEVKTSIDQSAFRSNEAFNMEVTISGKGNLKLLGEPQLSWPSDFEVFDPKVKDNIRMNQYGESGSRTFEYVVIPRSAGSFQMDGITFSYFDYKQEKYLTRSTPDFVFDVARGDGEGTQTYTYNSKTDVNILNQDILFLKTGATRLVPPSTHFFGSVGFFGLMSLPWLAFGALVFIRKRKEQERADVVGTRMKNAGKVAKKHLANAEKIAQTGEGREFYSELYRALTQYIGGKYNVPLSEMTGERIKNVLTERTNGTLAQEFSELLTTCEMARFAPIVSGAVNQHLADAHSIIQKIEKA